MKRNPMSLFVLGLIVLALLLPLAALAQNGGLADVDSAETLREQARAQVAERETAVSLPAARLNPQNVDYPLFVGVDDAATPAYQIDVITNNFLPAFSGVQVWGAGFDEVSNLVYFNSGSTLYEWPVGGTINQLGVITDPGGAIQSMVALAFYEGTLYGTKNIANEAVYIIDPATQIATIYIDYVDADYDFGGLAIDPNTGEFYATNDDLTPFGSGLYRINLDGTATFIVPYPAGETDLDGLAISPEGFAYLVPDEPGLIYIYDLAAGVYVTPLDNPWTTAEVFSGATWIWEPSQFVCNTDPITIPSSGAGTPYPSSITVSGYDPAITDVNVQLAGLSHTWPDDIDILLVGPEGENLVIMSDAGGSADLVNVDLIFDDAAPGPLPDSTQIISGTYQPTDYEPGDAFDPPAPTPSTATTLATFNGTNPNGDWHLYIMDDTGSDLGQLAGGWCLQITAEPTDARLAVAHLAPFAPGAGTAVTITLNATPVLTDFVYGESTPYLTVPTGSYDVEVVPAGSPTPAITGTFTLTAGLDYSVIAIGDGANQPLELLALLDDNTAPASGNFKLRLGHLAPFAAGNATADVRLQDGTPVWTDVNFGDVAAYLELPAGTYDLKITTPGGGTTLIDPMPATFGDGDIISAFATGDGSNQLLGAFAWPADVVGFFLPLAPVIEVSPAEFVVSQVVTAMVTHTLTITNNGAGDLDWTIDEEAPVMAAPGGGDSQRQGVPAPRTTAVNLDRFSGPIVADGSFEAGTPSPFWTEASTNFGSPLCTVAACGTGTGTGPRSGLWWAWFGGISAYEAGSVSQSVIIPSGTATLSFWVEQFVCTGSSNDYLEVNMDGNQVWVTTAADPACGTLGYRQVLVDVSAYANGAAHTLEFNSEVFGGGNTNFFVDDVSIDVSGPPPACSTLTDIPWVSLDTMGGTTAAGDSSQVMVTFDTAGLTVGNTYTGTLCINSNDLVNPLVTVPLTLTVEAQNPAIAITKTVGTAPGVCAATDTITVDEGTTVYYCYAVTNTGNVPLGLHDLDDSELGNLFTGLAYNLLPGASVDTVAAGLTISATLNVTTTNTATWTAYNAGPINLVTATASATVNVTPVAPPFNYIYLPIILKP